MKEKFAKRFIELDDAHEKFRYKYVDVGSRSISASEWRGWATSVENLIEAVYGNNSPHYRNFQTAYLNCDHREDSVKSLISIFQSAKADFEGGYVFDVELLVSGEVFGDFVALARKSLANGHKDVAAVLACAALEDAIKRLAKSNGLLTEDKTMADNVNALKAAGLVSGAQKTLLDAMPKIRNMAMHAEWDKLTEPDVNSVLGYVEQLLLSKFSGN